MVRSVVLSTVIVLSMALGAEAASYTIASDGNDEADCTANAACASIRRASELLVPGDTLDIRSALGSPWLGQVMTDASQQLGQLRGGLLLSTGEDQPHGFVRLAMTWSTTLRPQFAAAAKALPNLADVLNKSSGIAATVDRHMFIGTPEFDRSPFVFITALRAFELTEPEATSLKRHLLGGGFLFVDSAEGPREFSQAEAALRHMLKQALGRRAQLRRIPDHHPIYHGPHEFNGPPPGLDTRPMYALDGLFVEGRLVALFSDRGYVHSLAQSNGNEAQMRLFINAVHYALRHSDKAKTITLRRVDLVAP